MSYCSELNYELVIPSLKKRIEERQRRAKEEIEPLKEEYLRLLPEYIQDAVRHARWNWENKPWFREAWNKYRKYVLDADAKGEVIKGPGVVFNKYIDETIEKEMKDEEARKIMHSEEDVNAIVHAKFLESIHMDKNGNAVGTTLTRELIIKSEKAASTGAKKKAVTKAMTAGEKKRNEMMENTKNYVKMGKVALHAVLLTGALAAITIGVLKRRGERKNAQNQMEIANKQAALNRANAVKDAKATVKIDKILNNQNEGDGTGPERYPAGDPSGRGGQFKPKGA